MVHLTQEVVCCVLVCFVCVYGTYRFLCTYVRIYHKPLCGLRFFFFSFSFRWLGSVVVVVVALGGGGGGKLVLLVPYLASFWAGSGDKEKHGIIEYLFSVIPASAAAAAASSTVPLRWFG